MADEKSETVDGVFGGLDETRKVEARQILAINNCGEPVGYKPLKADTSNEPPCNRGCLAPGSSPHRHSVLVGYRLTGTTGYVETDVDLNPRSVGTIHSLAAKEA